MSQLLDEIQLLVGTHTSPESNQDPFKSSLLFDDHQLFQEHLDARSAKIRHVISLIFQTTPTAAPELKDLQERLATLLAAEKVHIAENQRITAERDQLTERLEQASYRYLMAEKKMDRAKSAAVQKLESQAIMGSGNPDRSGTTDSKAARATDSSDTNGQLDAAASAANDTARREAQAVSEKRKLQNDQLDAENKRLTDELTAARTRLTSLTDEDYSKTDLFKLLKSQQEYIIKQRNDLEASVTQLREENQKFHAERTAFRTQIEEESRALQSDLEGQLARAETDLARIRTTRDELLADVSVRTSQQEQQNLTMEQTKELADASQHRIAALESELGRIRLQLGEDATSSASAIDDLDVEALKTKVRTLESQYSLLEKELPSMEAAWRKTQALATKKVAEMATWEEQRSRLLSEKSRADQKYWAAQKAKEAKESELRGYKAQNAKYTEQFTTLMDADTSSRMMMAALEKQVADSKESLAGLSNQNRSLQQRINEGTITLEALRAEVAGLKKIFSEKDSAAQIANFAKRHAEVELEQLKIKLEDTKKSLESQKRKNTTKASSDGSDDWRVSFETSSFFEKRVILIQFYRKSPSVQCAIQTSVTT